MHRVVVCGPRGIVLRCRVAWGRRERAQGLIGAAPLDPDEALLIPNATSVHTFRMRFPILVARLDRSLRVVELRTIGPGRLLLPSRRASHVLECSTQLDLRTGDDLRMAQAGQPPNPAAPVTIHELA